MYTKGPWHKGYIGDSKGIFDEDGNSIAYIYPKANRQPCLQDILMPIDANANLIAAAPVMYELLIHLVSTERKGKLLRKNLSENELKNGSL